MVSNLVPLQFQTLLVVGAKSNEFVVWVLFHLIFHLFEECLDFCELFDLGFATDVAEEIA